MQIAKDKRWTGLYLALSFVIILIGYANGVMETFGGTLILLVFVVGLLPLLLTWLNLMIEQVRSKSFVEKMNGVIAEYQAKGAARLNQDAGLNGVKEEEPGTNLQESSAPEELYNRLRALAPEAKTDMGKAILNLNLAQTLMLLGRAREAEDYIRVCENCRYPNPVFRTELYKTKTDVLTKLNRNAEAAKAYAQWEACRGKKKE